MNNSTRSLLLALAFIGWIVALFLYISFGHIVCYLLVLLTSITLFLALVFVWDPLGKD